MKKTFEAQERNAFAKAVSAVEALALTPEQTQMLARFASEKMSLEE